MINYFNIKILISFCLFTGIIVMLLHCEMMMIDYFKEEINGSVNMINK